MTRVFCVIAILSVALSAAVAASDQAQVLEDLLSMMPESREFSEWLEASGELPPDFDAMPSYAPQQTPLAPVIDGAVHHIDSIEAWEQERERLLEELQQWIIGSVPPAPDNLVAEVLDERIEDGARVREVELRFGPDHKAKLWVQLYMPKGDGPFPVFMNFHRCINSGYIGNMGNIKAVNGNGKPISLD